jgi:hypothetical protein
MSGAVRYLPSRVHEEDEPGVIVDEGVVVNPHLVLSYAGVLRWKSPQGAPIYFLADPLHPERLCGCDDIFSATKYASKEAAEALPLALPLSDGRGLWDLYDFVPFVEKAE